MFKNLSISVLCTNLDYNREVLWMHLHFKQAVVVTNLQHHFQICASTNIFTFWMLKKPLFTWNCRKSPSLQVFNYLIVPRWNVKKLLSWKKERKARLIVTPEQGSRLKSVCHFCFRHDQNNRNLFWVCVNLTSLISSWHSFLCFHFFRALLDGDLEKASPLHWK